MLNISMIVKKQKYLLEITVRKTNDNHPIFVHIYRKGEAMPIIGYSEKTGIKADQLRYNAKRAILRFTNPINP